MSASRLGTLVSAGLRMAKLLDAAEAAKFDVLLTVDRGFEYEQNFAGRMIAVIIFSAKSIALKDLLPQIPACLALLSKIKHGEILKIGTDPD